MSIKFIHRRYITSPSKEDQKKGKTFSLDGRGGITVGYKYDDTNKVVRLAIARCATTDNFNRKVARDIVMGRLESKKPARNYEIGLQEIENVTSAMVEDIVWGWLENKERLWDAQVVSHTVH